MPWIDWRRSEIPCVFTDQRAQENLRFLEHTFRDEPAAFDLPSTGDGRLQRLWHSSGTEAFLEINWLAEDLRLLANKPGYLQILRDLSDIRLCQSTWHVVHTAALFERAQPGAVLELIDARSEQAPDLLVQIDGDRIPVEAKLLMRSEPETIFLERAKQLVQDLSGSSSFPQNSLTILVPKQPPSADGAARLLQFCHTHLPSFAGTSLALRGGLCNLFVEPLPPAPGISGYHAVWVMTPVPDSEGLRVLQRAKKASRQLRAFPNARDSGVMAIGLRDDHVSDEIFGHIAKRIQAGRFSGIAAVLLTKRRISLAPPILATVDLLAVKMNGKASHPIAGTIPLLPLANAAPMPDVERHVGGIYAWRYGIAGGAVVDPAHWELQLPDLRILSPEMLADGA